MSVRFANSHIDRLIAERDLNAIHHLISVVAKERSLPDEFWLFCRIYEWAPARSGIWQYYEMLQDSEFDRFSEALSRFGLTEIAEKYREGRRNWNGPNRASDLDKWLDTHATEIHGQIFDLIAQHRNCLRNSD